MQTTTRKSPLPIASTFSKDPRMFGRGFTPTAVREGYGAYLYADDGRCYLDWISGLGCNLMGYAHPGVVSALHQAASGGVSFSLPSTLERQVADKLVNVLGPRVPGWSADSLGVRFGKTGSDACSMAIRLARAVTGQTRVLSSGYHGWADAFISTTPPAWGVHPEQGVYAVDVAQLERSLQYGVPLSRDTAAVIIEPPMEPWHVAYWPMLRNACNEVGALLILDEVVTYPRWSLGGAAERYGIEPDICCYSKALGNGAPISAIVGRREYFDWFDRTDPVFISGTFFGETLGLAAAEYVLDHLTDADVQHIWRIGEALMDGLREAGYTVIGTPPRSLIQFASNAERSYFIAGMRDREILMNRPNLPCLAHTAQDVERTVRAAAEIKREMASVDVAAVMAGKEPEVLFASR